jgi:hypothetical protein
MSLATATVPAAPAKPTSHWRFADYGAADLWSLAGSFAAAQPFPHVVIPDFLRAPHADVLDAFPAAYDPRWDVNADAYEAEKMTYSDAQQLAEPLASMIRELNAPPYLRFLERVTGIKGLIPDPYLQGAGLHCVGPGGVCAPHTDNHLNERLSLYRRVNTLIYLNPEWDDTSGGCLELYRDAPLAIERTIVPRWGTCVIFQSDRRSVHGFSRPVVGTRVRRSIAVYHYTSVGTAAFNGGSLTQWRQHEDSWRRAAGAAAARRVRMHLYRSLRLGAKALAYLAHRTRPTPPPANRGGPGGQA